MQHTPQDVAKVDDPTYRRSCYLHTVFVFCCLKLFYTMKTDKETNIVVSYVNKIKISIPIDTDARPTKARDQNSKLRTRLELKPMISLFTVINNDH